MKKSMYFTSLPDHSQPGFDEQLHFNHFKKTNVIFNTAAQAGGCDNHVGCLSIKTTIEGEEWYGVGKRNVVVRPGQFLVLNDNQTYSCRVNHARVFSIFFKREFAAGVFRDCKAKEESSLDNPFNINMESPEFFQTLHEIDSSLQVRLSSLAAILEANGYEEDEVSEHLLYLLRHLIGVHHAEAAQVMRVNGVKPSTKAEVYKRLCLAKEVLHSSFMDELKLDTISATASLSMPQLIRQFKAVFQCTPHQYLIKLRLRHAADLLATKDEQISSITLKSGFENTSAFCRAFKAAYGVSPEVYRRRNEFPASRIKL
ncbi:MAG TPA: AraC family transcriptional regulator [Cyclobacteriaceae bacterium]|nr:AraC family transcriptional regulator [Cyclobacteriaceae bacterium]